MRDDAEERSGNRAVLEGFLEENFSALRAFVRLRMPAELRQHEAASDIVQIACLQILERGAAFEYQGEAALRNWVFGAVENAARDRLRWHRAEKRRADREARPLDSELLVSYASLASPSAVAAAHEQVERIERAVDRLTPAQREVLTLSRIAGLGHDQIAAATGRSIDAVRTHLHRGLVRLAVMLEREDRRE